MIIVYHFINKKESILRMNKVNIFELPTNSIKLFTKRYNEDMEFRKRFTKLLNFVIYQKVLSNNEDYLDNYTFILSKKKLLNRINPHIPINSIYHYYAPDTMINRKNMNLLLNMLLGEMNIVKFNTISSNILLNVLSIIYDICYFGGYKKLTIIEINKRFIDIIDIYNIDMDQYMSHKTFLKYFTTNPKNKQFTTKMNKTTKHIIFNCINIMWEQNKFLGMLMAFYLFERDGIKYLSFEYIFKENMENHNKLFNVG
jgi:hypothetical protein